MDGALNQEPGPNRKKLGVTPTTIWKLNAEITWFINSSWEQQSFSSWSEAALTTLTNQFFSSYNNIREYPFFSSTPNVDRSKQKSHKDLMNSEIEGSPQARRKTWMEVWKWNWSCNDHSVEWRDDRSWAAGTSIHLAKGEERPDCRGTFGSNSAFAHCPLNNRKSLRAFCKR